MRDQFNQTNFGFFQIKLIYKFWWHRVVVVVCCAGLGDQWVCCQAHYDSWCAWLLLIQQSRDALKLLTVVAVTISLGKAFQVLAILLKKKFSLCGCWAISLKYLKQWPLRLFRTGWKLSLIFILSILWINLYNWIRSPLFLLSTKVVKSKTLRRSS